MRIDEIVNKYLAEEGLEGEIEFMLTELAKGWDKESIQKFAKSIGAASATEKGFFEKCVARSKKHGMKDPEGFCADIKDTAFGHTKWRSPKWRKEHEG